MSDKETKDLIVIPEDSDLSTKERNVLTGYVMHGMPGVSTVKPEDLERMLQLYMSGHTYTQISNIMAIKKSIILFYATKQRWYEQRREIASTTIGEIAQKMSSMKVGTADFLTDLILAWETYYKDRIREYQKTGDPRIMETLDLRHLDKYFKSIDTLIKLVEGAKPNDGTKPPMIGLTVENGTEIKRVDENTLKISNDSDKNKASDILAALALMKRMREEGKTFDSTTQKDDSIKNKEKKDE